VTPLAAIVIGFAAGVVCYSACFLKSIFGYDDSLDVVGIHGVGGTLGILATGLFASKAINPAGSDGLIFGNAGLLGLQFVAAIATALFAIVGTYLLLLAVNRLVGLRLSSEQERMGLDLSQHNERAYS
jgi:Amt family ammonium transporter